MINRILRIIDAVKNDDVDIAVRYAESIVPEEEKPEVRELVEEAMKADPETLAVMDDFEVEKKAGPSHRDADGVAEQFRRQKYFDERCNELSAQVAHAAGLICASKQWDRDVNASYEWFKANLRNYVGVDGDGELCFADFEYNFRQYMADQI